MPERYAVRVLTDEVYGEGVHELLDRKVGSSARVAPGAGNNLFSFRVPIRGRDLDIMVGRATPSGLPLGNPLLFPFPGRVRNARFTFGGHEHQLEPNFGEHAIHGLVSGLRWEVDESGGTRAGAKVVASLETADHPAITQHYPFPFRIVVGYTLSGNTLLLDAEATNFGPTAMPMGFGIHPWFHLPLAEGGSRESCLIQVPANRLWEVEPSVLPTGRVLDLPAEGDFRALRPLGDTVLDATFTDLRRTGAASKGAESEGGVSECVYRDPAAGAELVIRADSAFRELVVYAPPGRPTICIEPLTCCPDALNLEPRGIDAGLIVLEPGASWRGRIWLTVRETA